MDGYGQSGTSLQQRRHSSLEMREEVGGNGTVLLLGQRKGGAQANVLFTYGTMSHVQPEEKAAHRATRGAAGPRGGGEP